MSNLKDLVVELGIDEATLTDFEAGKITASEIRESVTTRSKQAIRQNKEELKEFVDPFIQEKEKAFVKKARQLFELDDLEVKDRAFDEILELGANKQKAKLIETYKDATSEELVAKTEDFRNQIRQLQLENERLNKEVIPTISRQAEERIHREVVRVDMERFIEKEFKTVNTRSSLLTVQDALKNDGYVVERDSKNKLVLLTKDDKTAPLTAGNNAVITLEAYIKEKLAENNLLVQSNATNSPTKESIYRVDSTQSANSRVSGWAGAPKALKGLKAIEEKLNSKN